MLFIVFYYVDYLNSRTGVAISEKGRVMDFWIFLIVFTNRNCCRVSTFPEVSFINFNGKFMKVGVTTL